MDRDSLHLCSKGILAEFSVEREKLAAIEPLYDAEMDTFCCLEAVENAEMDHLDVLTQPDKRIISVSRTGNPSPFTNLYHDL